MRLLIILTTLVTINTYGQIGDTLYFDSLYREVKLKSSAKYIRTQLSYDASVDRFSVRDYYSNGKIAFEGQVRFINSGFADGEYTYYFENGVLRLKGKNKNIHNKDYEFVENLWHPNGTKEGNTSFIGEFLIHNYYDSLGKVEVKDGNGLCSFNSYIDKTIHKGLLKNGRKEGEWQIWSFDGAPLAKENYKNGKLIDRLKIKILERPDTIPLSYFGTGNKAMRQNQIEKEISAQLKRQTTQDLNIKKEIFYLIHVKDNTIVDVQLLRDKFIVDNKMSISDIKVGQKVKYISEVPHNDFIVLKFKVKL